MVHRVFRLSITPERAPEVRRVIDFDGRATLHDVHDAIQRELLLDDDHLYAFYLSGKYFDRPSEHGPSKDSPHDSRRSRLFRLRLQAGRRFGYLFDFGDEHRHEITVVAVSDVEAPLEQPVLVESVGTAPPQYDDFEEPRELAEHVKAIVPLAEAVLALSERLDVLYEEDDAKHGSERQDEPTQHEPAAPPEAIALVLREVSEVALDLAAALNEDDEALLELDEWFQERDLLPRLIELPLGLLHAGQLDSALAVARAFTFVVPESFNADVAIIFAESGKRDEAIAQLEANSKDFPDVFVTAFKAGEAFETLGDAASAEAAYRRALTLAQDRTEQEEALAQLVGFLEDSGRAGEIDALLSAPTGA
jgi:hypothetical protein